MDEFKVPNLTLMTDGEICREIGARLRAERLRRSLSQAEMSSRSGIPLRTYKRLESNGAGSIATLVAAIRACERLIGFHLLLPQPTLSERKNTLTDIVKRRVTRKKFAPKQTTDAAMPFVSDKPTENT